MITSPTLPLTPRQSVNKAFLKVKPARVDVQRFKDNLITMFDGVTKGESEEHHKNLIIDFLKKTYYDPSHAINTKGRNDLVIHIGATTKTPVGVIIEAKSPTNKSEMITSAKLNNKALQELVLYFLRERITHNNLAVKHLVVTNCNEWFIFDAQLFDTLFAHNTQLVQQFTDFELGNLSLKTTADFYKQIAEPAISTVIDKLQYTYVNLSTYHHYITSTNKDDDKQLVALFKLFSPEHLLKQSFVNDSNTLDKNFYNELLHIVGLTENKVGGKKLIQRLNETNRNSGSIMEDAVMQLDSLDKLNRVPNLTQYGTTTPEQLFNVAIELSITWINRILFLKLLEAQLVAYNKGNKKYAFLNIATLKNYDDLNDLFFKVLARKHADRHADVQLLFSHVPYLNSSLFEPTELEQTTLFISNLKHNATLPIMPATVLKTQQGKKSTGALNTLSYLFEFLDAYDFSSEGTEDVQDDNKTLINASVLGLIFEKINGYKDGSFFTPGFITMYMCRETIRQNVVQKFNEAKGWQCQTFIDLLNKDYTIAEGNAIINSLKLCDPAVGSGHFLVSALNEIIAVKHELKLLVDKHGARLKGYGIEVVNDELNITDSDGERFVYLPTNKESQRIQETLFNEKQTIIENCLFGVDINPNSVKICRLRLWIELLKNAYYKTPTELETLPNIDINIKCGNSLISRFAIDADLTRALKKSKWTISSYRDAVATYRNAENKEQKRTLEKLIQSIKQDFTTDISQNDPKVRKLQQLEYNYGLLVGPTMFSREPEAHYGNANNEQKAKERELKLLAELTALKTEIDNIKNSRIYDNAFEWRFEFPEVLSDTGEFLGFDIIIGNPPYLQVRELSEVLQAGLSSPNHKYYNVVKGSRLNLFQYFIGLSDELVTLKGYTALIYQNSFLAEETTQSARKFLFNKHTILSIDSFPERDNENKRVFDDVKMSVCVTITQKKESENFFFDLNIWNDRSMLEGKKSTFSKQEIINLFPNEFTIPSISEFEKNLFFKLIQVKDNLKFSVKSGELDMTAAKKYFTKNSKNALIVKGAQVQKYFLSNLPSQGEVSFLDKKLYFKENSSTGRIKNSEKTRLVMQRITGVDSKIRLITTIIPPNVFCVNSTNYIVDENIDNLKYLLAVLNSNLINYFFKTTSTNTNVTSHELEKILIPNLKLKQQKPFIKLVDKILALKSTNPTTNTTALEAQIDAMVYELYELTPEEVAIVEAGN